ncbi:hemolysin secretion protein D [Anaerosporomusa subterranea]|uniref:Hemolysin secretion protein D n=1 Tax=Anaerosporomusa subterranea TaxID=1794912 RepID=A0A154BRZ0_ANASB|nr:efflux RND transporter periplasmic adaptor subunit [Anaerosporomusa subterranea]KYZ76635.1 hemolysin secretion protein D [Anaerosporomusa subterranea]
MKRRLRVLILLLVAILATGGYFLYQKKQVNPNQVKVSGNIEVITVGVGFKVAGHVDRRLVDEGDSVKKGQIIANLETADLELDVANANAQLLVAQVTLGQLMNGSRSQDVSAAQAALRSVEADKQNAAMEYRRMQQLFTQSAVSAQDRDRSQTAYATASARADQAAQQLSMVVEGPRREEIELAAARVEQVKQLLKLAKTRLAYAQITAPVDGVVLSKNIEVGEYVSPGTPVVTIGDLNQVWLKAYIAETDLGKVKLGQKVAVTTDTYPNKIYNGTISFIASEAEFTPKSIQTTEERVKLVYRIKITVENNDHALKPGMPADAEIKLDEK